MDPAIATHGLSKHFGRVRALDGLDLTVGQGEVFGFLGPNGAGKSTTIRLLLDLIRPTSGSAEVLGRDCQADSLAVRQLVGQLPGDVRLYSTLDGRGHVDLFAEIRGQSPRDNGAYELAERLQLNLDVDADAYSRGNRQKLGLVLALMGDPPVLILDEPTSGLDPLIQHELWDILRERADAGTAVFFSSHVMSEVELVCERVAILRAGRLMEVNTVSALKARGMRHLRARFADEAPPPEAFTDTGVRELGRTRDSVEFEIAGDIDSLVKALAQHHVLDLQSEQPSLEELLMSFYEREEAR